MNRAAPLTLQQTLALAALFFLPLSALNFGNSFTIGDALLIAATFLNLPRLLSLNFWQIGFILLFPLVLASATLDRQGDLISVAQTTYLWGFVLPFGWIAFTDLSPRQIASSLVASATLSSLVAIGQSVGLVSEIGKQNIVIYGAIDFHRAAGLNILCNSLVTVLASAIALLPLVRVPHLRLIALFCISLGLIATVSKSTVFAIPAFIFYVFNEPRKKQVLGLAMCTCCFLLLAFGKVPLIQEKISSFQDVIDHRATHTSDSLNMRGELIEVAIDEIPHCLLLGYGPRQAPQQIAEPTNSGATVHMYYLGMAITYGLTVTLALIVGIVFLLMRLLANRNSVFAMYLLTHCMALLVETVLAFSFQLLPIITVVHMASLVSKHYSEDESSQESKLNATLESTRKKTRYLLTPSGL